MPWSWSDARRTSLRKSSSEPSDATRCRMPTASTRARVSAVSLASETADTLALVDAVGILQRVASDGSLEDLRNEVRRASDQLHGMAAERDARQQELSNQVTL